MSEDNSSTAHEFSHDPELGDWRVLVGKLHARFATGRGGFSTGAEFASRIAARADELDHHPDVDLRYPHVTVTTVSHDIGRLTDRDRRLAVAISQIAAELGLKSVPEQLSELEIALDVSVAREVVPFWLAVLGYRPKGKVDEADELADPASRHAAMWFQQMDTPRTERGRFHLDVHVPHDVAETRMAAALEAGGRLVTDEFAPSWWVLADTEGNEACICTWQENGDGAG